MFYGGGGDWVHSFLVFEGIHVYLYTGRKNYSKTFSNNIVDECLNLICRPAMFFGNEVNSYCVPFPGSDRSIVNRTQRFNFEVRKERNVRLETQYNITKIYDH